MTRGFLLGKEPQRALQDQAPAANSGLWSIWVTSAPVLASLVLGELIPYLSLSLGSHEGFVSPAFRVRQKKLGKFPFHCPLSGTPRGPWTGLGDITGN